MKYEKDGKVVEVEQWFKATSLLPSFLPTENGYVELYDGDFVEVGQKIAYDRELFLKNYKRVL